MARLPSDASQLLHLGGCFLAGHGWIFTEIGFNLVFMCQQIIFGLLKRISLSTSKPLGCWVVGIRFLADSGVWVTFLPVEQLGYLLRGEGYFYRHTLHIAT